jgi:hypothetical protein
LADQEETRNGEGEEAERALWFHRFFYGCEPDAADIRRILNLFKGYSTNKLLYYVSQLPEFHTRARVVQNIMLDSLYRKRGNNLVRGRIEQISPNAFVIGQPRAGTTSLHDYFLDHPDVYAPFSKETNYYSHWSEPIFGPGGLRYEDYLMHFVDAEDEAIRCDISPFYVSEPGVALRIYRDTPRAKILLILRDPINLIVSKYNLDHNDPDPSVLDNWIARGLSQYKEHAPRWAHDLCVTALFHCMVSPEVSEYLRYFKGRMKICIFEEMIADQETAFREICDFLEIPFYYEREYWSWRAPGSAKPTPNALRALADFLLPEVKRMEAVIRRDLSLWYSRWNW